MFFSRVERSALLPQLCTLWVTVWYSSCNSIRFNSIQYDSIRFDSIHVSTYTIFNKSTTRRNYKKQPVPSCFLVFRCTYRNHHTVWVQHSVHSSMQCSSLVCLVGKHLGCVWMRSPFVPATIVHEGLPGPATFL
jgi:hypothetical protein